MKRLSVCLIVFPFLGFTGPCMRPSPSPSSEQNDTDVEPPLPLPNQTELVTPTTEIPNPPPAPLPPAPPPPPSPPPVPPPPPIPEPEPVVIEPPLPILTCDQFPPLPLEVQSADPIIRPLTNKEATHFWQGLSCEQFVFNELGEISGCERLFAGTYTNALDQYYSVFRFPLTDLPAANQVESATLNLYLLQGSVFFTVTLSLDIEPLTADWWRECSNEADAWRPLCDYEMPMTAPDRAIGWHLGEDERGYSLLTVKLTELYRDWQNGTLANYGLSITQTASLFNFLIFAGPDHPEPTLRPYLSFVLKTAEPTLQFPLDGSYGVERISGYDFGAWWLDRRCDKNDDSSPRLRHTGIDFRASVNDKVYAVQNGTVRYAKIDPVWGGYVVLEHAGEWTSTYTHVIPTVIVGDTVTRGDPIATIAYGNDNFDPHLHFQVLTGPYDPLMARRGRLPEIECNVVGSPYPQPEPKFPEQFIDLKCLNWE